MQRSFLNSSNLNLDLLDIVKTIDLSLINFEDILSYSALLILAEVINPSDGTFQYFQKNRYCSLQKVTIEYNFILYKDFLCL